MFKKNFKRIFFLLLPYFASFSVGTIFLVISFYVKNIIIVNLLINLSAIFWSFLLIFAFYESVKTFSTNHFTPSLFGL